MKSTISLRIPSSYHKAIQKVAETENISMNQLIASAIGEKLSALETESYINERASRASRDKFEAALSKVPNIEPEPFDEVQ